MALHVLHKPIIAEGGRQEQAKNKFPQIFHSEEAAGDEKGDKKDYLMEDKGGQ